MSRDDALSTEARPLCGSLRVRAHVLAWRKDLEGRELRGTTIRRKLAALSSLFEHLCDANAVKGVKRPKVESYEGKTPALGDGQARALLDAPGAETEKGKRDRAILSVLLYHGLRREEFSTLKVRDIHPRRDEVRRALAAATAATNALDHEADIAKPRCRSGSDTPTSPPRGSMTGGRRDRRTARRLR